MHYHPERMMGFTHSKNFEQLFYYAFLSNANAMNLANYFAFL